MLPSGPSAEPIPTAADDTPPQVTYSINGIVGTNNWYQGSTGGDYVVVNWTVSDPESPITQTSGCEPATRVDGPNTGTTRTCSATSDGGTTTVTTKTLKIDATAPTGVTATPARGNDANGWYNHALGISWSGSDATSGIAACTATNYTQPDTANASASGTCTDMAGNVSAPVSYGFKYDATAPDATGAAPTRSTDKNGWFNHTVTINWNGTDGTSGIASCTSLDYSQPDSANATVSGTCKDVAGNTSTAKSFAFKYDDTPPSATASLDRSTDANGWYNHDVTASWTGSDSTSGIACCTSPTPYSGPDSSAASVPGSCTDSAGNATSSPATFKYDDTAPASVTGGASRSPDSNGWYNHQLTLTWNGNDPTSGIASCTSVAYSAPDSSTASRDGTCTDRAANTSAPKSFTFKYDATAPTGVSPTPARSPDSGSWYDRALPISWSGSDGTSGVASCTALTYTAPDSATANANGTCTDNAGNTSGTVPFGFKFDDTAPTTTVGADRSTDANGWYNHGLKVTWSGSDGTSGLDSCSGPINYSGPDSGSASVSGTCTDVAGNTSPAKSFGFKYDDTGPDTVASPSRQPDANGWYNHSLSINWTGTDPVSGIASCSAPLTYSSPDGGSLTKSGSCTDQAGNSDSASLQFSYDATAPGVSAANPQRSADKNGWYNHALRIDWTGSDATSGIASCTSLTYSGPDDGSASKNGTCVDAAGNVSGGLAFPFKYDGTGPTVAVSAAREPDHDGWYNQPVRIGWSGTDGISGLDSCSAPVTYGGPDSSSASSAGGCTDKAGNTASPPPLSLKYDATPPNVAAAPSRPPDANGWYNHPFSIGWGGTDDVSGIASCSAMGYSGPDVGSASPAGACTDKAGNTSPPAAFAFKYDATPPGGIGVSPGRNPDHGGWYNHALPVRWFGTDALAGIASCTSLSYSGPDTGSTRLSGACIDRAGNTSSALPFALRYDQTPPVVKRLELEALDDVVVLTWRVVGADDVRVSRSPGAGKAAAVYTGAGKRFTDRRVENYKRYRYTLTAEDAAGNTDQRTAVATPKPELFSPVPGTRIRRGSAPFFAWRPAENARYYNMQLWLDGRAVGSWWPAHAWLRLPAGWRFRGERHHLARGAYRWYVWPGRGPRKLARYGPLLGSSKFVVR